MPTIVVPGAPVPLLVSGGTVVGRYRIVEKLATGGMGVVFRAYDPELSRHVALKLVQSGSVDLEHLATVEEYEQRLLREAQALARLSHPNVVAAFDVGRFAGTLFIAMELIDGVSLRSHLMQVRSRDEVLRLLLEAGRGLAAAHRAGVVHRDFKLSNVMVSSEGRVQVVDFGLARTVESVVRVGADSVRPSAVDAHEHISRSGSIELTRNGAIMGTAGYIAPEQFESGVSDARSDQFSYASAAFRALTGQSPYPGDSLVDYRAALERGERTPWPKTIPRPVRKVIERGLSRSPDQRYPSLAALLADLERAARPPRRVVALLAVALGLSALASTLAVRERMSQRCDVDAESFEQVWNPSQRERTRAAFAVSANPRASDAFALLESRLDDYGARWRAGKQEACLAAHVRGEQSQHVLTLRNACLDGKLAQLGTMLGLFQHADAALVDRSAEALDSISLLRDCADVATLLGESERMPDEPAQRARFVELTHRYDTLLTTSAAGRWPELFTQADELARDAGSTGVKPIQARAMSQALMALERLGRPEEARDLRQRTLELASDARVYDVIAYQAVRLLLRVVDGERFGEAKAMLPLVDADVGLAGRPPALQIRLLTLEAAILSGDREWQAAIDKLELARAECRQLGTEGLRSCLGPQRELGFLHAFRKDYAAAHRELSAAVELAKLAFGPRHPSVMNEYNNLSEILVRAGDLDAASAALAQSKELAATLPANRQAANIPQVEAMILQGRGDSRAALPLFEEAARRLAEAYGERTVQAALGEYLLGKCLMSLSRPSDALPHFERSLELRRSLAAPPMLVAEASLALADALWSVPAQRSRAYQLAQRALTLFEGEAASAVDEASSVREWLAAHVSPEHG
ncbi:MAG TPA: serine/threonine-protein kinase [Polyangiaceae bacterium]|nr:serine/threonine-protein kinase [Polyangiaceae bacterium]